MADDDFDLDAMLDSALDEEFAATSTTGAAEGQEAGGEGGGDGDIDLDLMLDEAMVSASSSADQGKRGDESKRSGDNAVGSHLDTWTQKYDSTKHRQQTAIYDARSLFPRDIIPRGLRTSICGIDYIAVRCCAV